ncbi:Transcription elongation factor spt6, partial [Coemansia spiralis]
MSGASDMEDGRRPAARGRSRSEGSDEESDSFDTRRRHYDDDDEDEDEDEDDNDDELRRDGFVVDDDMEEEEGEDDEAERRRRRKERKERRRRRHAEKEGVEQDDLDALDDEDLALVAENTYGAPQPAQPKGSGLKRLKRGRSRLAAGGNDDDDLRAELDDLVDTGDDRRPGDKDALGLFDNEDVRGGANVDAEGYSADEMDVEALSAAPAAAGRGRGAVASFLTEGLEAIDDETWMELQDIFGTGEEYAFAMDVPVSEQEALRGKTLADVFEPAELEAKMMTQKDEDIRATDIPERMQMRATDAEFLRPLTEDEIEEETTWVVQQLHAWLTRRESVRAQGSTEGAWGASAATAAAAADEPVLFQYADFANERFLAAVLSVLKLLSQDFYEVPYIARHRREVFVTPIGDDSGAQGEEAPTREWLSMEDLWKLYDFDMQFRGFLSSRRQLHNTVRRLKGEGTDGVQAISSDDEAYVTELAAAATSVEAIADVAEWLQAQYASVFRGWAQERAGFKRVRNVGITEQAERDGTARLIAQAGMSGRQIGDNASSPGRHAPQPGATEPLEAARELVGMDFASPDAALRAGTAAYAQMIALDPQVRRFVRAYCDEHACVIARPTDKGLREITHDDHPALPFKFLRQKPAAAFAGSAQFMELEKAAADGLVRMEFSLSGDYRFSGGDIRHDDSVFADDRERTAQIVATVLEEQAAAGGSDDSRGAGRAWRDVRAAALLAAAHEHILPQIWRELAQRLRQQAFDCIADACRRGLEQRIDMQAPRTERLTAGETPRVLVVAGGGFAASSRGALRAVLVDEHGVYREDISADSMRSGAMGAEALCELLGRQSVDVVAVAGMTMQTRRLYDDVRTVVDDHCARTRDDIMVTYASDETARLWWDSARAQAELPGLRREERYCVSVARALQDPAAEYAAMGEDL